MEQTTIGRSPAGFFRQVWAVPKPARMPQAGIVGSRSRELPLRGGDEPLARLVNAYSSQLFAFLYRLVGDIRTVELLVENVFRDVLRKFAHGLPTDTLFALYEIATETATRHLKTNAAEPALRHSPGLFASEGTQEEIADNGGLTTVLDRWFALPLLQRAAVLLHKYDCLDYAAVGRVLHLDEETTASLVRDGYRRLCNMAQAS